MKHVNVSVKIVVHVKSIIVGNLAHALVRIASIADTPVNAWLEIISVMDIVSTKMTNTTATNMSKNSDDKKVRYKTDCYILHTVLLAIILLLIIVIICYQYAKHRSKEKDIDSLTV